MLPQTQKSNVATDLSVLIDDLSLEEINSIGKQMLPDLEEIPVGIEQFLMDKNYLGKGAGEYIRPVVKEDLIKFFDPEHPNFYFLGQGGIGYGKSFFVECAFCYELYNLLNAKNPQEFCGMSPGTKIYLITIADKEGNARDKIFAGVRAKILISPWFQDKHQFNLKKKSELEWEKEGIVFKYQTTSETGVRSKDVFSIAFDEVNFLPIVKNSARNRRNLNEYDLAKRMVDSSEARMMSRFMDKKGKIPGKIYIVSQSEYADDFTERKRKALEGKPGVFCISRATWETRGVGFFDKNFKVQIPRPEQIGKMGLKISDLKVLKPGEPMKPGCYTIDVPETYRHKFEGPDSNIRDAVTQLAGIRISEIGGDFIGDVEWNTNRRHPANVYAGNLDEIQFDWDYLVNKIKGKPRPRTDPGMPRFVHIDASLGTGFPFGLAMLHPVSIIPTRSKEISDEEYQAVCVVVDFAIRIIPDINGKISYKKVRDIIYSFNRNGFEIAAISSDQYQSQSFKQPFEDKGFYFEEISVQEDITAYKLLQTSIDEKRLDIYYHPLLAEEFRDLQQISVGRNWKIQTRRFKDMADCLAGALMMIQNFLPDLALPEVAVAGLREAKRIDREDRADYNYQQGFSVSPPRNEQELFRGTENFEPREETEEENYFPEAVGRMNFSEEDEDDHQEEKKPDEIADQIFGNIKQKLNKNQ